MKNSYHQLIRFLDVSTKAFIKPLDQIFPDLLWGWPGKHNYTSISPRVQWNRRKSLLTKLFNWDMAGTRLLLDLLFLTSCESFNYKGSHPYKPTISRFVFFINIFLSQGWLPIRFIKIIQHAFTIYGYNLFNTEHSFLLRFVQLCLSWRGIWPWALSFETIALEEQPARLPLLRSPWPWQRPRLPHPSLGRGASILQKALHGSCLHWVWIRVPVGEKEPWRGGRSVCLDFWTHLRPVRLRTLLYWRGSPAKSCERLVLVGKRSETASNQHNRERLEHQPLEQGGSSTGQQGGTRWRVRGGLPCLPGLNIPWPSMLTCKVIMIFFISSWLRLSDHADFREWLCEDSTDLLTKAGLNQPIVFGWRWPLTNNFYRTHVHMGLILLTRHVNW